MFDTQRLRLSLALVLAGIGLVVHAGTVEAKGFFHLNALLQRGADVSAMAVDLGKREILAELRSKNRLTPASVSKLYATAAALEKWGPDHRFTTRLVSDANIEKGILKGDLVFAGSGDPALHDRELWQLVARLRQAGVKHVTGNLIIDDSLFGSVPCLILDRCNARSKSSEAYSAPLSGAGVNFSTVELMIYPADKPGQPATVKLVPPGLNAFDIEGTITTGRSNSRPSHRVWRTSQAGRDVLRIGGQVPAGSGPYTVWRSVARPSRYTGRVLAAILADSGVQIDGRTLIRSQPQPGKDETLAAIESDSLAEQLRRMMTYSNNFMADTLTLDLAVDDAEKRPLTLPLASQTLESLALRAHDQDWLGSSSEQPPLVLDSGSGLSTSNKLSAHDVVALLAYMYRRNDLFPAFLGTLPVPLHTPSRSLKRGNDDWLTRLAVKTGTLTEPVSVRGLAGYMRLSDGGWGAFAVIVNGTSKRRAIPLVESMGAIRSDLQRLLEQY